jgi:hypothetical protein
VGIEQPTQSGAYGMTQPAHGIEIFKAGGNILQPGMHKERIMDIEFTVYNGQQVYFTSSLDGTVKAWQVG